MQAIQVTYVSPRVQCKSRHIKNLGKAHKPYRRRVDRPGSNVRPSIKGNNTSVEFQKLPCSWASISFKETVHTTYDSDANNGIQLDVQQQLSNLKSSHSDSSYTHCLVDQGSCHTLPTILFTHLDAKHTQCCDSNRHNIN